MRTKKNYIVKTYVANPIALMFLLLIHIAHSEEAPKFSATELKSVYEMVGLKEQGGKYLDECGQFVEPNTEVVDLNGDGQPDVFVMDNSSCNGGIAGSRLTLLIKNKTGRWESNLGFPAAGYKLLSTKNKGYPDIEIGGPGLCSTAVWRWNGAKYTLHKRCDR